MVHNNLEGQESPLIARPALLIEGLVAPTWLSTHDDTMPADIGIPAPSL